MSTETTDEARRVERALADVSEGADEPMEIDPHPDRTRAFSSTGFSRMQTNWNPAEQNVIDMARQQVERELLIGFAEVYRILNRLYEIVRRPVCNPDTGEVLTDRNGFAVWAKDDFGMVQEDWGALTEADKDSFLHQITTRLVIWEQIAADYWGDAMYAKGSWEERFATGFMDTPPVEGKRPTVDDRTHHGQSLARDQRYLAIYMSVRSKKADALVRSMERLARTLRDTSR
jgi:hypothetical protein